MQSGTLLLIEDHPMFAAALKQMLAHHYPALSVSVAPSLSSAMGWLSGLADTQRPQAVLCDLVLPDVQGLEVISRLSAVTLSPIVVLSAELSEEIKTGALRAGAQTFVSKREDMQAILLALAPHLGPAQSPVAQFMGTEAAATALSPSQARVARLLVQGHPNKEIARLLKLTPETVKSHVREIMGRSGARNRTEAVLKLLQVEK